VQEYTALKEQLLDNTRKSGGAIGAYLLFTVNGTAALLAMVGAGASYGYMLWLCRDVDAVKGTDTVPIWEANRVRKQHLPQHVVQLLEPGSSSSSFWQTSQAVAAHVTGLRGTV
jgi:hypothetical protein